MQLSGEVTIPAGSTLCLDLNGQTITAYEGNRAFTIEGALNVQDSAFAAYIEGGELKGTYGAIVGSNVGSANTGTIYVKSSSFDLHSGVIMGGSANRAGNIYAYNGAEVNIYGGIVYGGQAKEYGGNICVRQSELNISGGTIYGGSSTGAMGGNLYAMTSGVINISGGIISNGHATTNGGNVCINSNAILNIYGGTITGGTADSEGGNLFVGAAGSSAAYIYGGTFTNGSIVRASSSRTLVIYNANVDSNISAYVASCSDYCVADGIYKVWHKGDDHAEEMALVADADKNTDIHSWQNATCTDPETCANCGQTRGKANGHDLTGTDASDDTCTAAGNSAYWTCEVCGKYFSDEEGKNEIEKDSWIIDDIKEHTHTYTSNEDKKTHTKGCEAGDYNEVVDCVDGDNDKLCDLCGQKLIEPKFTVDGVEVETLAEALTLANNGSVIKLLADLVLTERLTIATDIVFDLNGYSITGAFEDAFGLIYVKKGATLTVKGGLIENTADVAIANYGKVIVEADATINAYYAGIYNMYHQPDYYGEAVVNGKVNEIWNSGKLEIAGGAVVEYLDNSGYAVIDGTVNEIYAQDGSDAAGVANAGQLAIADTSKVTVDKDYKLVEVEGGYKVVAKVYVAEANGTKYETFEEAFAEGGEIKLLADLVLTERLTIATDIVFDLNGYSITGAFEDAFGLIYVKKGATLTVKGGLIENTADVAIANYGKVIVEADATINAYYAGIYNMYHQPDYYGEAVVNGKVNEIWNSGKLEIAGGAVVEYLDNSGYAVIDGTVNEIYAQDGSDAAGVANAGQLAIADTSKVTVDKDYKLVEVEGGYKVVAKVYVAEANGEKFETLADALAADGEIKLIADIDATASGVIVAVGETIDLNGYKLTADIIGVTIKMNGGNFATSKHLMIGATAGKYTSTDAVFTIAPNATFDMTFISGTITLNENKWYTVEGQTLTVNAGATFVIPEGKELYVNGSTIIVEGIAKNYGTLTLANGAWVKGDIAGTFQMAGGTFETGTSAKPGYVMIGATQGKYLSSDAKFTILPNMDMIFVSGTVTLHENKWYTLEGQTLTVNAGATFVIPEGKELYVNGSTIIVEGIAKNYGTLTLANGAWVKGDIAGTFQMAGGTFETGTSAKPGYVMIGATQGKYLTNDAVFTIAPNATFDMTVISGTITLNDADWWTLAGQTLTIAEDAKIVIPAGKNINVQGTVIVNGTAQVDGTVTLYNADATVKAAADLNVVAEVGICVVYIDGVYSVHTAHDYADVTYTDPTNTENGYWTYTCICGDSYIVVDEGSMFHFAINETTGESYESVQAALEAAAKGDTVKLLKDAIEEDVYVSAMKTLDLNGHKLTAETVSASFSTSHIIDSSNGKGLLVVDMENISLNSNNSNNTQLPLWTDEGARFVDVNFVRGLSYQDKTGAANSNVAFFRFAFSDLAANTILDEYLINGTEGTCVSIRIKATWSNASGTVTQYFTLSSDLVEQYANWATGWDRAMFAMYLTGVEGLQDLTFTAEIVSTANPQATVVVASAPIPEK